MNISTTNWYVQLFYFCEMVWRKFTNSWYETNSKTTNLCTFIRTIFVLAPLAIATNIAAWGWMIYTFLYYPFHTFGVVKVGIASGLVVGCTVFVVTFAWVWGRTLKLRDMYWKKSPPVCKEVTDEPKKTTFIDLIWQYLVDAHNNICVMIKLEQPTQETVS